MLLRRGGEHLNRLAFGCSNVVGLLRHKFDRLGIFWEMEMTVERVEAFLEEGEVNGLA